MKRMIISKAKKAMRQTIEEIIDPPLNESEQRLVWQYFDSQCAYCGKLLQPKSSEAHIDHLVSRSNRGGNALGNCVLACDKCNGNEKRDIPWETFLASKCIDPSLLWQRTERILEWMARPRTRKHIRLSTDAAAAKAAAEEVVLDFEAKLRRLKSLISLDAQ